MRNYGIIFHFALFLSSLYLTKIVNLNSLLNDTLSEWIRITVKKRRSQKMYPIYTSRMVCTLTENI